MEKAVKCKEMMSGLFGPATGDLVEKMSSTMTEQELVEWCKKRIRSVLGENVVKQFDGLIAESSN